MPSPDTARDRPLWTEIAPEPGRGPSVTTTAELRRFGRRYPAVGRAVVAALCAVAGPFAMPPAGVGVATAVAAGVVAWNVLYLAMLLPDGHGRARLVTACTVDLVLVCALCLAEPLLVDPGLQLASLGWVSPIASFTVVAVQFQLRPLPAATAAVAVCLAFVVGTAASPGLTAWDGLLAGGGGWMLVEAVLARLLWNLLLRGGREADRLLQARFAAERAAATAAARRADQRAHWTVVHDTSASTLLMIGLGEVAGTEEWLPGQVQRDIAMLDGRADTRPGEVDLAAALRATADRARVAVELDCPADVRVPAAVSAAVNGAVAEALENVRRHAGTGCARLVLRTEGDAVHVEVADDGRGFDPARVGPLRFGLAWSVHDRMQAVGGRAAVESETGRGTVVRLGWPA
jgi:signal transduction histidine kinase